MRFNRISALGCAKKCFHNLVLTHRGRNKLEYRLQEPHKGASLKACIEKLETMTDVCARGSSVPAEFYTNIPAVRKAKRKGYVCMSRGGLCF